MTKLPQCWNCNKRFRYRELLFFLKSKKCNECGEQNYLSVETRQRNLWLYPMLCFFIPLAVLTVFGLELIGILLLVCIIILGLLFGPFIYKFSGNDESAFEE